MEKTNPDLEEINIEAAYKFNLEMLKKARIGKVKIIKSNVMVENKNVRQRKDEGFRRWFLDDYFDFIVWYNSFNEIVGFQICYNKKESEKAITWQLDNIFSHHYVSSGSLENMTAILKGDPGDINQELLDKFEKHAINIEKDIVKFVLDRLNQKLNSKK